MKHYLAIGQCLMTTIHAKRFSGSPSAANTGSISKPKRDSADTGSFFDGVTGGSRYRRDNRPISSNKGVEEAGLPDIGTSDNRDRNAVAQNLPLVRCG